MAKKLEAPTLEYLLALETELTTAYSTQDGQIDRLREVREMTRAVALPDDYRLVDVEVRDPAVADECQRVPAMLSVNPAKLTVTGRPGDEGTKNATKREHFTENMLRVCGSRTPGIDTFRAAPDACASDGGAWTKFVWSKDLWDVRYSIRRDKNLEPGEADRKYQEDTEEAKRKGGPPFTWLSCDVRNIYPAWQGTTLGEVLEIQERPVSATFRKYRLGVDRKGDIVPEELAQPVKPGSSQAISSLKWLEHWDDEWATYALVGNTKAGHSSRKIIKQWRHRYGRVPYFFAPGLMMSHWRNRKVGWGIAEAKRWLVEYRSFLWTVHANIAARDALTPMFRELPDGAAPIIGQDGRPIATDRWKLGQIINGRPGEKLSALAFPAVAQSVREQIAIVSEAIERLETPRTTGDIGGLEGAGFAINQVLAEGRIRHDPIAQNLENMYAEVTDFSWYLIREVVREVVWVRQAGKESGWLSAGPDDLTDTVGIEWKLDPERPSAKLIEARYWHERLKEGTANREQAIEAMGDNPDEVRLGQAMDRIREKPWYQKFQEDYVLQEVGRGDLMAKAKEAEEMARTGIVPGAGLPPLGGAGMPGDQGQLALAPGGAMGGPPLPGQEMGSSPGNLPVPGVGPGTVVPERSAAAGMV